MSDELILTNAKIVTRDSCFAGTVAVSDGAIAEIGETRSQAPGAVDLDGDYLIPGLVELHTDHVERHFMPRPGVKWPREIALLAHDAQIAAAGITTVLDAIAVGDINERSPRVLLVRDMVAAVREMSEKDLVRAEHFLHLRCELTFQGVVETFAELAPDSRVRLVSLMDHTPGQRQFVDVTHYRTYYQGKYNLNDEEIDRFVERQKAAHDRFAAVHRGAILAICRERGFTMASHDDATPAHVDEAIEASVTIAEFPTTMAAAQAAREAGLSILMGAPNLVMGKSHSGNISAGALAKSGHLDILSSDYVPMSMLHGAFMLASNGYAIDLPEAIAKVSATPAQLIGLDDRGEIAAGKRADLVRVKQSSAGPVVRAAWREGRRIV